MRVEMRGIKDKVTIVTGAAQGIGRGIAACFARQGARLIIADLQEEAAGSAIRVRTGRMAVRPKPTGLT